LVAPLPTTKPDSAESRAIQDATANLLEPIFLAQSAKNQAFLAIYQRMLIARLAPLLKNHLIPRVQPLIVLAHSASPQALKIFEDESNKRSHALWAKFWALEGIANIKNKGGRLTADAESRAGKIIADFLERADNDEIPWPVKSRALQAMGALRQGFLPTQ